MGELMKTLVISVLACLSVSVYANDNIDAKLDDLNTKITELVSDTANDDGSIVSVSVKRMGIM